MKSRIKLVVYIATMIALGMGVSQLALTKTKLNPKIPNLYAPHYRKEIEPAFLTRVMPKDSEKIIKNIIMIKPKRARQINEFKLESVNGPPIDSSRFAGKVTMLYLFGAFSKLSQSELPQLGDLAKKYKDKGFEIYGIVTRSRRAELDKLIENNQLPFTTAFKEGLAPIPVTFVPTSLFLDKKGRVRAYLAGRKVDTDVREAIIEKLLQE